MTETLIYIIIFAALMFFMHRGHGSHGDSMGGCGGHSHGSNKGESEENNKSITSGPDVKKEEEHQHHH